MTDYDIIVVGAGHAGCEAAVAAARLGSKVLLITMDMRGIAQMSCNPAIGGIAKGQIVREIDALGGFTGIVTDASTIQFRMLNRSKGPAMWSPRAQCDKQHFTMHWRKILESTSGLDIWQDIVTSISFRESKICGVRTLMGSEFKSQAVIITAGTFLDGKLFIGQESTDGGRMGEMSSYGIGGQLAEAGIAVARMKTGTPPRIDARSIDLTRLEEQPGDENPARFSFLPLPTAIQSGRQQKTCFIVHTNKDVHEILKRGFDRSPLFTGKITGIGPRYCPSIEDKLRTFAGKDAHQLFLEPEGWNTCEYYLQGFSSSLPLDVQMDALRHIEGFENVKIFRPAYAVEYDYFDPTQLNASLESRVVENLFLAGQVNGTTGYEEAAAQGLMAGINAHLKLVGEEPFVLKRDEAYIGVLIDDLITKGVDEPYRMFTSRAEYRILLRQDNADARLTAKGYELGLADEFRYRLMMQKYDAVRGLEEALYSTSLEPSSLNPILEAAGSAPVDGRRKISDILTRPDIALSSILENIPESKSSPIISAIDAVTAALDLTELAGSEMAAKFAGGESSSVQKCGEYVPAFDIAEMAAKFAGGESSSVQKCGEYVPAFDIAEMAAKFAGEIKSAVTDMAELAGGDNPAHLADGEISADLAGSEISTELAGAATPAEKPCGRVSEAQKSQRDVQSSSATLAAGLPYSERLAFDDTAVRRKFKEEILESGEIHIKYKGYIERERRLADKILKLENIAIPDNFDFSRVSSLSIECRIKLNKYRPKTIAQASRISGISPADISVLLVYFGR